MNEPNPLLESLETERTRILAQLGYQARIVQDAKDNPK